MVWLLLAAQVGHAMTPASTRASTASGAVTVAGVTGSARHDHGGPPARLGSARFEVRNTGREAVVVGVRGIVFLTGHACDAPPTTPTGEPVFAGLFPVDGSLAQSAPTVSVRPGVTALDVGFPAVEATYTWCDRFAFQVTFDVGGEPVVAIAETEVTRETPLRPR